MDHIKLLFMDHMFHMFYTTRAKKIFVKGAQSRLNGLKSLAKLFNFVVFQSVSIFSILNHPCSFML